MKIKLILFFLCLSFNPINAQIFVEGFHVPGNLPRAAAFGDLNGDGYIDFVQGIDAFSGNSELNANLIWLNNGDTTFELYDSIGVGQTRDIEVVDIDNDGDLDILSGDHGITKVYINDGYANFESGAQPLDSQGTTSIAVGDFNEDGLPDAFIGEGILSLEDVFFINQGNEQFSLVDIPWTTGAKTSDAVAKDINSDGHMDLIISRAGVPLDSRQENEIWFGDGAGGLFKSPQSFPHIASSDIAVGDYNGDNNVDVIFIDYDSVIGYLNDGTSYFNNSTLIYSEPAVMDINLIDVDVDDDLDLVIGRLDDGDEFKSLILFNDGDGNFTDGIEELSAAFTFEIEYVDIDLDNDIDILVINRDNQDSVFWINQSDPELSVNENEIPKINLYPNPTLDILFIESPQPIETVKIYNLQGQLIKEVSSNNVDVSQLTTGLYFVQVVADGKSETKKFVKN